MTVSEQWRNAFVLCPATDLEVVERMAQRAEEAGYAATLVGLKRWAETQPTAEDDEAPLLRSLATKSLEGEAAEASRRADEAAPPRGARRPGRARAAAAVAAVAVRGAEEPGPVTIVLFYAYCEGLMSKQRQTAAIKFCVESLKTHGVTGRLRVAREGYNGTLTGPTAGVRAFTASLETFDAATFGNGRVDFKYVDGLPRNQMLKGVKCWPVAEIVTYGFDARDAPLDKGGTHLAPADFHRALEDPDAVVVDVRNYNESLIGKFAPPGDKVLDPMMRRSTEFPKWVADNRHKLEDKKVLMYCTGGVRCELASAYMGSQGIKNVFQLEGGIHRYLEEFQSDGGHWVGKNYTFDKRFSHGADNARVISACVHCGDPWHRYQAQAKCANRSCAIEPGARAA
ncbi:hypothetical protein JL720_14472 [Aureococcus anophagefferens]|nr:hypothetical protein JL720_14472 [Aureococcus anophagefferens]